MDNSILEQFKQTIPAKSCMITILFVPKNDQQAIELKAKIDAALAGIETHRYSFNLEQRMQPPKANDKPPE